VNSHNFFVELKRRNVIRMAGLYLVGAWLLTQVVSTVLPMFGAPDWLPRSVVILLAIGFIPAMIFSWVFELTPKGLKREEEIPAEQSTTPQTGRRMDRVIIVVLVMALAYFAFDKFVLTPRREAAQSPAQAAPNGSRPNINPKSIAVLPFVNMSADKNDEYLSDGMTEELINVLARVPGLRVPGRTSCFAFKGKNEEDIFHKVGDQLHVGTIFATIYLGLDQKEKCLDWLEKSYEQRDSACWYLKIDQIYDKVHNEPRFQALVQKVFGSNL